MRKSLFLSPYIIRPYYFQYVRRTSWLRFYTTQNTFEPLRILFCGSDDFSIASLQALYREHQEDKDLVASLDVVCRPAKPVGRGLKEVRPVPISRVAKELSLPLHSIDTFTNWQPPEPSGLPINLIIAVSFGLFVPPRILEGARYGGLNVHPSMLPDFHGPAPLHHTLLAGCLTTGITVQTLHPKLFDQGTIIAQTPYPGFEHNCRTVQELLSLTSPKGADMLVQSIKHRLYLHPVEHLGALDRNRRSLAARAAPKIKPLDRYIDWNTCTAEEILRKHRVIGPLWSFVHNQKPARRIIWTAGFTIADKFPRTNDLPVGQPLIMNCDNQSYEQPAFMRTCDDQILRFDMMKIEGGVEASPLRAARKAGMVDLFRSREKDR